MDTLMQKYTFMKIKDEDTSYDYRNMLSDYIDENEEKLNIKMILASIAIVQNQVCRDDYSEPDSPPGQMAESSLERIITAIETVVNNGKAKYKDFYDALLGLFLKLLSSGPGTIHLNMMKTIIDSIEFPEWFRSLRGEKVKTVVKSLRRVYAPKKIPEDYSDNVQSCLRSVFDYLFSEEQFMEHKAEFVELYGYFLTGTENKEKELREMLKGMAEDIESKLGGNIYSVVDTDYINKQFGSFLHVVLDKNFPRDDDELATINDQLSNIFKAINENGLIEKCYEAIMNFLIELFRNKPADKIAPIVSDTGYFFYHLDEENGKIPKNEKLFTGVAKKLIELLNVVKDKSFLEPKLVDAITTEILIKSMGKSKEHVSLVMELISKLLKYPVGPSIYAALQFVIEKEKILTWQDHKDLTKQMFLTIASTQMPDDEDVIDRYTSFTENFLEQLKKRKVVSELNEVFVEFVLRIMKDKNEAILRLGTEIAEYVTFDVKKNKTLLFSVVEKIIQYFNDEDYHDFAKEATRMFNSFIYAATDAVQKGSKSLKKDDMKLMVNLLLSAIDKSLIDEDNDVIGGPFYSVFSRTDNIVEMLSANKEIDMIEPVVPHLFDLLEHDNEDVVSLASTYFMTIAFKSAKPLAPHLGRLIEHVLRGGDTSLMSAVSEAYDHNPQALENHFPKFMELEESGDSNSLSYFYTILVKVSKKQPELFNSKNVESLIRNCAESANETSILMILDELAKRRPELFTDHIDAIFKLEGKIKQYSTYTYCSVLKWIGMKNERHAEKIMNKLAKKLDGKIMDDYAAGYGVLDAIKHIGSVNKPLLEKQRKAIETLKQKNSNQNIKDICTNLIDFLEGRSLEGLAEDLDTQGGQIENLDSRVTTNENDINDVKEDVTKTKDDVHKVKIRVNEQGQRIDEMGRVVDETVLKVEEIDSKTLSHAPYWSRDVSKLLNPQSEHDWRLLSSRLGYSNDDIRAWAQQSDPCMAMLNEWYACHKTSEASYGVLTALQEMNRMDAAIIVENAMKAASQVVEDEEFEYETPPPIFLSYQWSHQDEVKLLRQHLEMAGYDCWMDIGQMGGGDKLFEKIDRGIRAAKIIISCTTEKYAKSPNCNREVNLSVNLRKPLIPLLLEKCPWPPEGSMGPIFSEYLYIQFYQSSPAEHTKDNRYWPIPKFKELLMQLNLNGITPDENKVHKMYKDWWKPLVEEIKIDKSKTANGGKNKEKSAASSSDKKDENSPDVFISYQWDKQKNIMLLYKKLTEMGYDCWMDIYQMGGGDSLYDKIDRGVRGCQVVLSCLTDKYTLSANCRREISLTDNLKRPIIPLLLESIQWPPRGPMSMAFTELLYIDLHSDPNVQEKWTGPKFDEIIEKVNNILGRSKPSKEITSEKSEIRKVEKNQEIPKSTEEKPVENVRKVDEYIETSHEAVHFNNRDKNIKEATKSKSCTIL